MEIQDATPANTQTAPARGTRDILFVHRYLRAVRQAGWLGQWNRSELALILAYLSYADRDGVAWPGLATLAQDTGMIRRNITRTRAALKAGGYLLPHSTGQGSQPKKWRLALPSPTPPMAPDAMDTHGAAGHPPMAQEDTPPWRRMVSTHGALRHPNSIEQTKEQTMNNGGPAAGGGGVVSPPLNPPEETAQPSDERLVFLEQTCRLNITRTLRAGLAEHAWTLAELKAKWKALVNAFPPGSRQAPMAAAVAHGDKVAQKT